MAPPWFTDRWSSPCCWWAAFPFRYLITLFLCVMCVIPLAYFFGLKPYQKKRVEVFMDMLMNKKVDTLGGRLHGGQHPDRRGLRRV